MGWSLKKAFPLGRFFRLNVSKSGTGASIGVKGARVGIGPKGAYTHLGRHGVYLRKSLGGTQAATTSEPDSVDNTAQRLVDEKPPGWEYLLFAHALDMSLRGTRESYPAGEELSPMSNEEAMVDTGQLLDVLSNAGTRMTEVMNNDFPAAIGPPGEPADNDALITAAFAVGHEYLLLFDAKQRASRMPSNQYFVPLRAELTRAANGLCAVVDRLPEDIRRGIRESAEAARLGQPYVPKLTLVLEIANADALHEAVGVAIDGMKKGFV